LPPTSKHPGKRLVESGRSADSQPIRSRFRENVSLRNVPAVVNEVPGAIADPGWDWADRVSDPDEHPVAFAPHLRKASVGANAERPALKAFAKDDCLVAGRSGGAYARA